MPYNESVLERLAIELQRRATMVIIWTTLLVGILGAGATAAISSRSQDPVNSSMVAIGGLIGALVGYLIGNERAFGLKYQAQVGFCLVQIERNTRTAPAPAYAPDNRTT